MRKQTRFLAAIIMAGGLVAGGLFYYKWETKEATASKQLFAMDTVMSLQATGKQAQEAIDAAVEEIERLDALLSTGSEDSEVSKVNAAGEGQLSEDTLAIVREALEVYEETDGLFDITIYPIMRLWGFTDGNYHVPTDVELEKTLELVGADRLELSEEGYLTLGDGQEIDLGGIAKGYTSAKVAEIFEEYGITSGLMSLGGNVQAVGARADGDPWRIGIRDPQGENAGDYVGVVEVTDKAVITSGGYERYFEEDGQTYIHIIDPQTGYPADGDLASTTIVTDDGMLGDALSTALYLMGSEAACDYWRSHSGEFDMVLIKTDGTILISEGIADSFSSERSYEIVK